MFRIFDCFNIGRMRVAINAVKSGKVAEVCLCYTGDILTSPIYSAEYYRAWPRGAEAGSHDRHQGHERVTTPF